MLPYKMNGRRESEYQMNLINYPYSRNVLTLSEPNPFPKQKQNMQKQNRKRKTRTPFTKMPKQLFVETIEKDHSIEKLFHISGNLNNLKNEFCDHFDDIHEKAVMKKRDVHLALTFKGNVEDMANFFSGIFNVDFVSFSQSGLTCPILREEVKTEFKKRRQRKRRKTNYYK